MTITLTGYLVICTVTAWLVTLVEDIFSEDKKSSFSTDFFLLWLSLLAIGGIVTLLWNYLLG